MGLFLKTKMLCIIVFTDVIYSQRKLIWPSIQGIVEKLKDRLVVIETSWIVYKCKYIPLIKTAF